MHPFSRTTFLLVCVIFSVLGAEGQAAPPPLELEFFEKRIRPVLSEHCYSCHSAESDRIRGGLRVDSRASLLQGGDTGAAIVPGDPDNSLLIKAVRYTDPDLQMPPRKGRLPDARIADLIHWIRQGAAWPEETSPSALPKRGFTITEQDRSYWAFQPIRRPALPSVKRSEWVVNGIDAFILASLEAKGLTPNPAASPRELVRRVHFDLLGLPPSPAEVAEFVADPSGSAYERIVDRLLARPEYGERWARHWLDVARYAQSNGYERDSEKPLAWRYRDYVINAFNQDKPYDRFLREQIAGDELPDATLDSIIATGFQRLGVWDDEPDDAVLAEYDGLDDIVSTTGAAFLGLTLGCARCHDHKFDPISQKDYYQFLAFFRNIRPNAHPRFTLDSANYLPLASAEQVREWEQERTARIQTLESQIACEPDSAARLTLQQRLKTVLGATIPFEWALAVRERSSSPIPTHLLIRGNPGAPGPEVEPGFPDVLGGAQPIFPPPAAGAKSAGRRRILADWIASPANPLTARVAVNRVWHHHFGQGIVRTTADFGRAGSGPTHPELLAWLAAEFIDGGWSFKRLHRLILLSNTYRMSSRNDNEHALAIDPASELLWRQRLRRLDAECVWDAALSVSGELNLTRGGRGFFPHLNGEVLAGQSRPGLDWERSSALEQARRSIYIFLRRTMLVPLLETLDYNNTTSPLAERPITTVAPQALMLLNGDWAQARATALAERLAREAGEDPAARIRLGVQLVSGRRPTLREVELATSFLARQTASYGEIRSRLTFRPDVPASLYDAYRNQLQPSEYLRGPGTGWAYYSGRWSEPYEGIRTLDRQRGPFALWTGQAFADGQIEAGLLLHSASEGASILLRSEAEKNEQRGYEVFFDPRQQRLALRRHQAQVTTLAEAAASIPTSRPFPIRIQAAGGRIQIWIHGRAAPVLDATDPEPLTAVGRMGVRSAGAALSLDGLTLRTLGQSFHPGAECGETPGPEELAWQSFCLLLLNLNEFVYVD